MKTCVAILYRENKYTQIENITNNFKTIRNYAKKIGADFIIKQSTHGKYEAYNILTKYDRIIVFSPHVIIRKDCPNLFELVDEDKIGMINEAKYINRTFYFNEAKRHYNDIFVKEWDGSYYNTDVMIIPKKHRNIFKNPHFYGESDIPDEHFLINLRIFSEKIKTYKLSNRFNRMHFMDEKLGEVRHNAYIINYVDAPENMLYNVLTGDILTWKNTNNYSEFEKRNIVISVTAGMGDQLCSEPVIRYIREKEFPNDNITVVSHWPRLFEHIENINLMDFDRYNGQEKATLVLRTCPNDLENEHHLDHVFFHPTDFAAMSTIKNVLPLKDKTIKLGLKIDDYAELIEILPNMDDLKDLTLVHAGKWWESKTFPIEWWQEVINKLAESDHKVALIGKTIDEKQGYLPLNCPDGCYDFRDLTSLGGLISLISQAKILLSNDSSPIHIGGAFDNWIVTIATAKHADHILPYRNCTQYYKTLSLEKKLLISDSNMNLLNETPSSIDKLAHGHTWDEYLPDTDYVVEMLNKIKNNKLDSYYTLLNSKK